jgi:uncharacterized membrane protein YhaH (DUF805 family)
MGWVWFLFGFDGRINRAKLWLAMLVIVGWMMAAIVLILRVDGLFGYPLESIHFNVNDVFAVVDPAVLKSAIADLRSGKTSSPGNLVLMFIRAVCSFVFGWIYIATSIKRLHDRDKSGWWIIPYFLVPGLYCQFQDRLPDSRLVFPLAIATFGLLIWAFIELYFLKGTRRTNRFGPNPLPKEQTRRRGAQTTAHAASGWDQTSAMEFVPHRASGADLTFAKHPAASSRANVKS